jgi:arginine decarboxylase
VLFSTNGSSMNVHVALMTVAGPGETVVMARNGHKSSFAGLVLAGARPVYVDPYYDEELEIALGPLPADVAAALDAHPQAKAVLIFTPSYYGTSADVKAIADICHERDVPLVTDDAWGLDYSLSGHPELPEAALEQGSDLAIGSVHKTLSGLSQTSIIAVKGSRIDTTRLSLALETYLTTSACSLLLGSIDGARRQMVEEGEELIGQALRLARRLRAGARELGLPTFEPDEILAHPSAWRFNELHVTMDVQQLGMTGYTAADWLRGQHALAVELADHRRIMAAVSHGDTDQSIDRALAALGELVERFEPRVNLTRSPRPVPGPAELRTEQVMTPREAFYAQTESVPLMEAPGRVAAEFVTPYPPGIPLFVPGERITANIAEYLKTGSAEGIYVEGCADQSLSSLRVVA